MYDSKYRRVKDINSVPCARRINGEKAMKVCDNWAYLQYNDGMVVYHRNDKFSDWEVCRVEICTNF